MRTAAQAAQLKLCAERVLAGCLTQTNTQFFNCKSLRCRRAGARGLAGLPVSVDDVHAAAGRIRAEAVRTPLLRSAALDRLVGGELVIKPENLQRTGSFKFRGGYNRLAAMDASERAKGVVAFSSGNHAQGVAAAAQLLGARATIVMPTDAPRAKMEGTRALGAAVVEYDRYNESREAIAARLCSETGATLVPSFEDPYIIAGQGTVGLEAGEDLCKASSGLDQAVFCCGGGGLSSGSFLALRSFYAKLECYTVEPCGYDDTARSLASGKRERADLAARSVCDALLTPAPGEMTMAMLRALNVRGLVVDDEEALGAVRYAAEVLKLVVEPGGAVALAAVLSGKVPVRGRRTLIVLSGGNLDAHVLQQAMTTKPCVRVSG